ncbi:endo-1,4-beta-xylanase xylA, putative (macronuclear) [Tetrahymena thermophila SB210]|uniref:Endo-1,4-beta-xylanase xylA, putative n=1 Tax=Tetrahymena thermophila (strain SB210) TaxID=312017 RepID=Q23PX3_TETTS|nr:endo-1,4-beta-xylanase xylA, putative [Tetrahymena thermophila SB210]EAR98562.2 endo-1,4-beta-xylanase xylA, putative [Tetrahymena thermophila SB210]|eukprot:XP_001018807.2 endo-1,4-beta-xylanase xylA, putative [Tetrahymena thermophila SB210]
MNFNRVIQPQLGINKIKNIQQSPIKYNVINQQSLHQNIQQNGYLIQNGSVQTYFTPIKQAQNRSVPQINITPGPNSSAQTIQMSPFQSYNSKILTAATVKGLNEVSQSGNQQFLIFNQQQNAQFIQNQQDQQSNIMEITRQVPQPPKNHHQSKRIFDEGEQNNTSYGSKIRANQSSIIENNTSLGNISQRGNLRNSSFIRNTQYDKDQNISQKYPYNNVKQNVNSKQYQGSFIQRNSSHEQNNRSTSCNQDVNQKKTQNDLNQLKRNLVFEKINKQSFGSQQNVNVSNPVIKQSDLIPGQGINNNQFNTQQQTIKRNNIFATTNSNSIKASNNTSGSLFILNTSQDQVSKGIPSPSNYQSNDVLQTQQSQIQSHNEQERQIINNNLKIDLSQNTLNVVKYTPKQEIFSFENSQIYIEDQVETPLAPHMFQHNNFTQSNINSCQNADTLNFFSTNQNEQMSKVSKDKSNQDEFNSHDYKVSLLEVTNNDTYESNKIACQIAGNSNNEKNVYIKEFDQEKQLFDQQTNRINELQAENVMLRNNLQEIKEMYNNSQINITKFQNTQEENNQLKIQILQLQLQNKEYLDKIKDYEQKSSNAYSQNNYFSNENSTKGERKSQNSLNEQLRELQEKNELLSKEKVSLMELLLNQEKLYNQLSQDFLKQQNSQESQRFSQPAVAPQIQMPHPKYIQQLEDQVKSLEKNIETLKTEIIDKDNLIQQMQFDLKDSQKQLGLFTDQILVLKEKLEKKDDDQRLLQLEKELISIQNQNKSLIETNSNLQKHIEMLEQIKTSKPPQQLQQQQQHQQQQQEFQPPQRVQLSKYFDQNRENELQIKPSLGGQAYLNSNSNHIHTNYSDKTYVNKQNYEKFMSNGNNNLNNKYQNAKNQNQILFTVNSSKKLSVNKIEDSSYKDPYNQNKFQSLYN